MADQRAGVADHGVVDREPFHELQRRAAEILLVDADEDDVLAGPRFAAAETTGASWVHGGQYDCQKFSTTTFPFSDARLSIPSRPLAAG